MDGIHISKDSCQRCSKDYGVDLVEGTKSEKEIGHIHFL